MVLNHRVDPGFETVALQKCLGRRLAEDLFAPNDSPRFDSSAMDGWAVGSAQGPWKILGESAAGSARKLKIKTGQACRIFTGAKAPEGCWGILAQEDAQAHEKLLSTAGTVKAGSHLRRQGEELKAGSLALVKGARITPAALGVIASMGFASVPVERALKVTAVSTGSEIVRPGRKLTGSQVYESNSQPLLADLRSFGFEATHQKVKDQSSLVLHALEAASKGDLCLTIGGISVGDYDLVASCFEALGGRILFRGVKIKPGKPVAFGAFPSGCLWFGLPGNPMSSWTTYFLLTRALWGEAPIWRKAAWAASFDRRPGREEFMPVRFADGETGLVEPLSSVGSHAVSGFAQAQALARIPAEMKSLRKGESVQIAFLPGGLP